MHTCAKIINQEIKIDFRLILINKIQKKYINIYSRKIKNLTNKMCSEYLIVEKDEMENFMERCMLAVNTKPDHAKSLASCLIAGDHRGHFSHGLNRLDMYVRDVKMGTTNSESEPAVIKETPATAL